MENTLPKGWVKTEFANLIAHVIGGDWGKDSDVEDENFVEVYCIRGSEIKNWNTNFGDTSVVRKIKKSSLDSRRLINGDILLEISGGGPDQPVGRVVLITQNTFDRLPELPIVCTNFLRLIRPVSQINSNYFCSYLEYFYYSGEVVKYQGGSNNLRNLKYKEYETIQIPLPPLPEQERIVAKLDKLFAQHEKIKKALDRIPQLLKTFRQQVLTQAVTGKLTEQWREGKDLEEWDEKELQEVAKIVDPHPSHRTPPEFENGIPYISIGDIDANKKINFEKARKVNPNILREHISRYTLKFGDFIFGKIGTIGKPIKIPVVQNYCLSANVILIQPKEDLVLPQYVYIYLDSPYLLAKVMEKAVATSQAAYGIKKMRVELISIPPKEEQKEIVHRVESLFAKADTIEARYHLLKAKIDSLPQAILHKAFKGELVPQLPTDGDAKDLLAEIMALKKEVKGRKKK